MVKELADSDRSRILAVLRGYLKELESSQSAVFVPMSVTRYQMCDENEADKLRGVYQKHRAKRERGKRGQNEFLDVAAAFE
jgi:hypothetical protein